MIKWTDEVIEAELRSVSDAMGRFPSNSDLVRAGYTTLASTVSKKGGFVHWADRLGMPRQHSDSDTGWQGEREMVEVFQKAGLAAVRTEGVKAPFDLVVENVLRVDVKSARYAVYGKTGQCRGWFYRTGKMPQADLVVLYQMDTGNFYGLPWFVCPTSNITITITGGIYAKYLNNFDLVRSMIATRYTEHLAYSN